MESYNVIATPSHQYNDPNFGEVKILFYYDSSSDNPVPLIPTDDIFKSKSVWITSGYDNSIQDKYAEGELFLLKDIQRTRHAQSDHNSTRDYHDWCGRGSNATRLNNQFIPVIEIELPNIDSGLISAPPVGLRHGLHFIEHDDSLYGPFDMAISDGVVTATPSRPMSVSGTNDHITKTSIDILVNEDLIFECNETFGGAKKFITNLKDFGSKARQYWEEVDYISAKRIFKHLLKTKTKSRSALLTKKELIRLEHDIEKLLNDRPSRQNPDERLDRAIGLLQELQGNNEWFEVMESFHASEEGSKAISLHFKSKLTSSVAPDEIAGLDARHSELKGEISKAEAKLQDLKQQHSDTEEKIKSEGIKARLALEKDNDELISRKDELLEGLQDIEQQGLELKEKYKRYQRLAELESAIEDAQEESRDLEGNKRTMEKAVKRQQELLATPESLAAELTSVHTVMQSLGYSQFSATANARDLTQEYLPKETVTFDSAIKPADLVVTLTERINASGGRTLSSIEVGNLLICMQQHIIVILKGRPGVGKTSTAIKMAEALGIKTNEALDADYLNVPVARGWSSSRDLLGYYNSLRGEFQPAKTGIYQFLRNGESDKAVNARMILLDEANLSPIEHYWSDFIGLCDVEGADRAINTGSHIPGEQTIRPNIDNNLRFVATINSDSTVEPLSDRLLDRAPVVCMDASDEHELTGETLNFTGAISNELLEEMFGHQDQEDVDLSNSIEQISEFLKRGTDQAPQLGNCLYIDGRRRVHIERYLQAASTLFEDEAIARDFAIAQYVLPPLRCDGAGMEDAIKALIKVCEERNWERSEDILRSILARGDKYLQHYSFL